MVVRRFEPVAPLPVRVQHMAVPQVGDAGAAQPCQRGQWCGVGQGAQHSVYPLASAFQRGTVVGRAQCHQVAQVRGPRQARLLGDRLRDMPITRAVASPLSRARRTASPTLPATAT